MKTKTKNNYGVGVDALGDPKGITLIALIITIIIMLILVAITINVVINSGLIGSAKNATQQTRTAYEEEANLSKIKIEDKEYNSIEEFMPNPNTEKTVTEVPQENAVASVNGKFYGTLEDAIYVSEDGDRVELLVGQDNVLPQYIRSNITIEGMEDGIGLTCSGTEPVSTVDKGIKFKNLVIKFDGGKDPTNVSQLNGYHGFLGNGTINFEGCSIKGLIVSNQNMIFKECTFSQTSKNYALCVYKGEVTIDSSAFYVNRIFYLRL